MKNVNRIHEIINRVDPDVLALVNEIADEEIQRIGQAVAEFGYPTINKAQENGLIWFNAFNWTHCDWDIKLTVDGMAVANHLLACRELENAMGNDLDKALEYLNGGKQ